MVRMLKRYCGLAMLGLGVQFAAAFSLLGPYEGYQVPVIAYHIGGDLGGPMNLGEEYRQNTPVLYYTYDQNFLDYFGASGVAAVDSAFSVFNALTNVSAYTADLSEWPLEAKRFNYKAQVLGLTDLKSMTMTLLAEQAGLAEPDRFTWTLRNRRVGPGGCPANVAYAVIKRNFETYFTPLDQLQPSSYVNGTLYSYQIFERCTGPDPLADAVEFPVDPLANTFTAIASWNIEAGGYFTGLTRDDIAGLRYMLRTNNMNIENSGANTVTVTTNSSTQLLVTEDLAAFAVAALTNDAAALTALYPGLIISSSTPYYPQVITTNINYYFKIGPWDYALAPATLASNVTYVTNLATWYHHTFANIVTNSFTNRLSAAVYTVDISATACGPYSIPSLGMVCTNTTSTTVLITNQIFGDFYIIPTNLCGVAILSNALAKTIFVTNSLVGTSTNAATVGTTNIPGRQYSQNLVYSYTQNTFIIHPVTCPEDTAALRQGIERVQYVRRDYDSLFNAYFTPITNSYTLNAITNNTLYPQTILRVVSQPDLLITARDLLTTYIARSISFNGNNASSGLAGPGTLQPGNVFTFNKVGPIYLNQSPDFLVETNAVQGLLWGSFDGTTNAPVIYPNGTSIFNLENQVLIQIGPASTALPGGTVGVNYTNAFSGFTVTGGTAPYVWSIAPTSPSGLPAGLVLSAATGVVSGVPGGGAAGIYDITIRLTDAGARFVDRPYTLTINP